jgi:O-methyltransferase
MKRLIISALGRMGYDLVRRAPGGQSDFGSMPDLSERHRKIIEASMPFTMTSVERMVALVDGVTFLSENSIPGDIAECGVWRGGSMMTIALTLLACGDNTRSLYLFDTFEGMSAPTLNDKSVFGVPADEQLRRAPKGTGVWCYADINDVRANLVSTGYPESKIHMVKGKVEDTIPGTLPGGLSLLRLDTDWYESTKHELTYLYPLLHPKGLLIIDDYGHWQGAKKAVDEYFNEQGKKILLHRIDYTGRLLMKAST